MISNSYLSTYRTPPTLRFGEEQRQQYSLEQDVPALLKYCDDLLNGLPESADTANRPSFFALRKNASIAISRADAASLLSDSTGRKLTDTVQKIENAAENYPEGSVIRTWLTSVAAELETMLETTNTKIEMAYAAPSTSSMH